MKEERLLTSFDLASSAWVKLSTHIAAEIQHLRMKNDNDADAVKTAHIRGRIAALKNLLALGNPDPAVEVDDGS